MYNPDWAQGDYIDEDMRRQGQLDAMGVSGGWTGYTPADLARQRHDDNPLAQAAAPEAKHKNEDQVAYQMPEMPKAAPAAAPAQAAPRAQFQPAAAPTPSFAPVQAPSGGGGGGQGPAAAPVITDEVTALLRKRLADLSNPLDVTGDPIYQNQLKAFNVQQQRNLARQRAQLAERRAASNTLQSGGFNTGLRSLMEQTGENTQAYAAGLAGQRLQQREAQLNQAIAMARAVGQDDVAMQLENQKILLAQQGLALQGQLGFGDLALRGYLGQQNVDLGFAGLGYNYANMGNALNRDAVLAALNG